MGSNHALRAALALAVLIGLVGAPAGCGTDDVGPESQMVGGRCTTDHDCVRRCLVDPTAFPGGYCTVSCTSNGDCPAGSACVAREGGICLATCKAAADCADYGAGYTCAPQTSQSAGGDPRACIGG
jgi:hypothetical protein